MNIDITLYICKTVCWNCNKEFNAAYTKWDTEQHNCICSPENFSDNVKEIAKENGVNIKTNWYEHADGEIETHTTNICPYCNKPFGNNYIKRLVGNEFKEIKIRSAKNKS